MDRPFAGSRAKVDDKNASRMAKSRRGTRGCDALAAHAFDAFRSHAPRLGANTKISMEAI
ncbi:hypothetical protein [Jannaschia faecimaris]|uniref:hypothetical protein n=1 Tax=Jannaschia faecimaris TaxID=1244108 RepID=UPI000B82821C|nr:hypothetical protein [Jannaschia faecimaris]